MLGLFFIYFIGKAFYTLSEEFGKSKWLYAILGVLSYYTGTFIGGIIVGIVYHLQGGDIETISEAIFTVVGLVIGGLTCWGFYAFLKHKWNRTPILEDNSILDDEFL